MLQWLTSVFPVLLISLKISAYNLNTSNAIVFNNPRAGVSRGSYFGYAVALYASMSDSLVLVGAPRDNSSQLPEINQPGAVYYCELNGNCREWPITDTRGGISWINRLTDEAWIGASISVESTDQPRVVICAPRWTNAIKGQYRMRGICYYTHAQSSSAFQRPVQKFITDISDREFHHPWIYRVGSMGLALHVLRNEPTWKIMIGAPGCFGWSGTALLVSESDTGGLRSLSQEKLLYWNTYSGYSVTSGYYFDDKARWFVTGAPQVDKTHGKIEIYDYKVSNFRSNPPVGVKTVWGRQYGEYFGSSVTSCDVDNDGRDEIIVGAPSWSEDGDEGRIYIVSAEINANGFDITWIDGTIPGARFGSSVVHLGDLDHDGYGDIAVGAPYENDCGAVYIFNGGRYGLSAEPSQKLLGKDYGNLRGFGFAISEPRDIDRNGYPDIAVGAYQSGHAVLFRSQPVVKVNISLNYVESAMLKSGATQFSIEFCGYYSGWAVPDTLKVKKIFKVDEAYRRAIIDKRTNSNGIYEIEGFLNRSINMCNYVSINLKEGTKTYPMVISASLTLVDPAAIINQRDSTLEHSLSFHFQLDCQHDNICYSNLTSHTSTSLGVDNKYVVGGEKIVNISVDVRNYGEPAYEAEVHVLLPGFIALANRQSDCEEHPSTNGSLEVICQIGNPLRRKNLLTIALSMRHVRISSDGASDSITLPIRITTQSENVNDKKGIDSLVINFIIDATVDITGKAKDTSYSYLSASGDKKVDTIQFHHVYGVRKFGVTGIQQVALMMMVPTHLRTPKHELLEIARINATSSSFYDTTNSNDNGYSCSSEGIAENQKKMIEMDPDDFTMSLEGSLRNRALIISCESAAVVCVNVTCIMNVPGDSADSSIITELELTIDLLLENFIDSFITSKDIIYFVSNGSVLITQPSQTNGPSKMRSFSLVSTQFLGNPIAGPVAIWVIAVSVLIGILLLGLLIFALIQLGFFKRKQKVALEALIAGTKESEYFVGETTSSKECLDED